MTEPTFAKTVGTAAVSPLTRVTCCLLLFLEKLSYVSFCPGVMWVSGLDRRKVSILFILI